MFLYLEKLSDHFITFARNTSLSTILAIGTVFRFSVLIIGLVLDHVSNQWHYTDIDYSIYSDAGLLAWEGFSPYERPTFRYPPVLAWLMIINQQNFSWLGKLWFIFFDILIIFEIWFIKSLISHTAVEEKKQWCLLWALNPFSTYIATRGSFDSISNYMILLTTRIVMQTGSLKYYQSSSKRRTMIVGGLVFGLTIYFRIYPVIYTPAFITYLHNNGFDSSVFFHSTMCSLLLLFTLSYSLYGHDYLKHSIIYHIIRMDHRHNFSTYFYYFYLSYGQEHTTLVSHIISLMSSVLQFSSIALSSIRYASSNLPFCLFVQTLCFVILNKVITGQYFLWILALVAVAWDTKLIRRFSYLHMTKWVCGLWLSSFFFWLFCAFEMEMRGQNTLFTIWIASTIFLCINILTITYICDIFESHCIEMKETI